VRIYLGWNTSGIELKALAGIAVPPARQFNQSVEISGIQSEIVDGLRMCEPVA
jgi:hypothetical protein